ncbi:hypothetical protein [Streptomyces litchfieldiae]|uniref:Uncharacterized protein n=1 Tax=Streptomyces litchfieldiae TaxID=3075543 RepID=A0ABU2N1J8_9ACTN|nr:hypothetical protein [Streptomyces sp. DSM 44938]MDT0347383.1 hypothetical protein [Streptomyces sp. DSM 44938]
MADPERLLEDLLAEANAAGTDELPGVLASCAGLLGFDQLVLYLTDVQQRNLLPLAEREPVLPVDGSLAGWAYRTLAIRVEETRTQGLAAWFPLVDGTESLTGLREDTPGRRVSPAWPSR